MFKFIKKFLGFNESECSSVCKRPLSGRTNVKCTLVKGHTGMHKNNGESWDDASSIVSYGG